MEYIDDRFGIITKQAIKHYAEVEKGYTFFQDRDILFAKITPCMENGKCAIAKGLVNGLGFGSTEFHVIRTRNGVIPEWVYYYLRKESTRKQAEIGMTGSAGQKRVPSSFLEEVLIPLPFNTAGKRDTAEQKRIVAILEKADRLRRLRRYALELSGTYLQAVFLEMFESKEHKFDIVTVEEIAGQEKHALSSGPFGSNLTSVHYTHKGVIVLRGLNISDGEVNLNDVKYISEGKAQKLARSEVKPNDIVVVAVGSSGMACKIPQTLPRAIMSQNFNKITPDPNKIDSTYLEYLINSKIVQNQLHQEITDTVRTFLSLTKLKTIKIPLPPPSMQKKFAQIAEKHKRLLYQQREAERQAEHLFQTLLHKAFQGELTLDGGGGVVETDAGVDYQAAGEVRRVAEVVGGEAYQLVLPME
jgi:type I restriction enzyme S subunit